MKHLTDRKIRVIKKYQLKVRGNSVKFQKFLKTFDIVVMSYSHVLFLSTAIKFETTVFLRMTRDFRVLNNSFGLPALFEKFINKCLLFSCD